MCQMNSKMNFLEDGRQNYLPIYLVFSTKFDQFVQNKIGSTYEK